MLQFSHLGRYWVDQKYSGLLPGTSSGQLGHVGLEVTGWTRICVDRERGWARGWPGPWELCPASQGFLFSHPQGPSRHFVDEETKAEEGNFVS